MAKPKKKYGSVCSQTCSLQSPRKADAELFAISNISVNATDIIINIIVVNLHIGDSMGIININNIDINNIYVNIMSFHNALVNNTIINIAIINSVYSSEISR